MITRDHFRVLITEDDALMRAKIQSLVEQAGHLVVGTAEDGRQAIEMAHSLGPDLVLMDISMPEADGFQAARQIQLKGPKPVIFLTTHDDPDLVVVAGDVGACAYLIKPPVVSELNRTMIMAMARFDDWMQLRRLNAQLQQALSEIKTLEGLLPICSLCKKVRDDKGYWHQVENYVQSHSKASFTHSLCDGCFKKSLEQIED